MPHVVQSGMLIHCILFFPGGEGSHSKARPRSARAAAAALAGMPSPMPPPDAMQLRRALASKLKTEVVDTSL